MQSTIKNRTIFCKDNLEIMKGIDTESIDLIYLDPPFNKKKVFTAPIGSTAEGASFKDIFTLEDIKDEWTADIQSENLALYELLDFTKKAEGRTSYNYCYLAYMAVRLLEMHRILKDTGSIYLHCDSTMSHYLKLAMDCIFGEVNFKNEIVWYYKNKLASKRKRVFTKSNDIILFYVKSCEYKFLVQEEKRDKPVKFAKVKRVDGKKTCIRDAEGNVEYFTRNMRVVDSVWTISMLTNGKEYIGYPTQKPLDLLERIIKASTNEGDTVLDPFCGCATTCVAAEKLGRQWIGIDISIKAYELVQKRLQKEVDEMALWENNVTAKTDPPKRTDLGINHVEKGFIYVISHEHYTGEYKVGIAKNVKSRLNSYQTRDPDRAYKLEFYLETEHYRDIEKHIHACPKFIARHEWVRGDLQEIIQEIQNFKPNITT